LKNHYELLSVAPDASGDDIKKAFRREIARYHPDKVQHLGKEFQEMAAGIAADLTEAYRILMDPALRAAYDGDLKGSASPAAPPPPSAPPPETLAAPPPSRPSAGLEFVRRAAMSKVREAVAGVLEHAEPIAASGFDLAIVTRPKKGLFKKAEDSVCLLVKWAPLVDAEAVADVWPGALRVQAPAAGGCVVMLIGAGMAPPKELATAVSEQRRKRAGGPVLVPVDVRDWEALFPPETPGPVRSLIQRLKDEKR
jgi:hypothetical protein